MYSLIKNEMLKIINKKSVSIMWVVVCAFIIITNVLYKSFGENHNLVIINFFEEYSLMICLLILIISSFIVSDEFNKGTIKSLLNVPYKRNKILLSKLLVCLIWLFLSLIFVLILQLIIGSIVLDFHSLSFEIFKVFLLNLLGLLPMFLIILVISFFINTVFISSLCSMLVPLIIFIFSDVISNLNIRVIKFLPNYNWNFTDYIFNKVGDYPYTNLLFSVIICLAYFSILILLSFVVFNKRDIKSV